MSSRPMRTLVFTLLLAFGALLPIAAATAQTREQIQMIEDEYAESNNDRRIPDDQLEYYLDQLNNNGWSMSQVREDIALAQRAKSGNPWRPRSGWVARELICTSEGNRYRECPAPFRGRAVVTYQISQTPCIEERTWGQKAGMIWVDRGCRARFGMVVGGGRPTGGPIGVPPTGRVVVACQSLRGGYKECATGVRGRVELANHLGASTACVEDRTWGQRPGVVWVTRGCRAEFASIGRPGPRDDGGWNSGYAIACTSSRGIRAECEWDRRYGRPRLDESYSRNPCIENSTWGYDPRESLIWVTSGCRARFVSTRTRFAD